MSSKRRGCINDPDIFCYICGSFVPSVQRQNITPFVKNVYYAYFGVKLGDQDKVWAPHKVCRNCVSSLRQWSIGKLRSLAFGVPMVWREPNGHGKKCYFCSCVVAGFNVKNKHKIQYPNLPCAIRPIPHGPGIPIPLPPRVLETVEDSVSEESLSDSQLTECSEYECDDDQQPNPFNQAELNDLVRDLNLPKSSALILGSRLKAKRMLSTDTTFAWYKHRENEYIRFFTMENSLVYCVDIQGLIEKLGTVYNPSDWRLFIDASKSSLKAVLLHNTNQFASIPLAHSTCMKESYENMKLLLGKLQYSTYTWKICVDFKVLNMLLGQQSGFTKYPCFMCEWDSRDRSNHWIKREWPLRESLTPGCKNILHPALVDRSNVILPPLHIKLGLMKQFVKALNKEGACFKYIQDKFPNLSAEKVKQGVFVGPQIRKLTKDPQFLSTMTDVEKKAWLSFVEVVSKFLGNTKDPDYQNIVENMLACFQALGCRMSLKVHFLHAHLDYFPQNLGNMSEEHGERFHQDIKSMETRYQGQWDVSMMADYCWCLKRDCVSNEVAIKAKRRKFMPHSNEEKANVV